MTEQPKVKNKGGRPKGSLNKKTQELAAALASNGITPLDYMVENMRFWRERADEDYQKVAAFLAIDPFNSGMNQEEYATRRREALEAEGRHANARDRAHVAAKDAAPYMHPRLQAIEHNTGDKGFRVLIEGTDAKL